MVRITELKVDLSHFCSCNYVILFRLYGFN